MKILRPKRKKGFTLIEVLVAIGISSIVLGAVYGFYRAQNRSYILQDQIAEMQQMVRLGMDMLVRDVRMAGFLLGCGELILYDPAIADTVDLKAITAHNNADSPDSMDIIYKSMSDDSVSTTLTKGMPDSSAELNVESTDGFNVGDIIMLSDGSHCYLLEITEVQSGSLKLQHNPSVGINPPGGHNIFPPGGLTAGCTVTKFGVDYLSYSIGNTTLMLDPDGPSDAPGSVGDTWDPQSVAENIEDLQFRYGLDTNSDDVVDSWVDDPTGSETQIRSVRIWILGRTREQQPGYIDTTTYYTDFNTSTWPDRSFQPNDGYRRRMLYSEVSVRNLGL